MSGESKGKVEVIGLRCCDCGRRLSSKDRGLRWERCQICDSIICFDCSYYIRCKTKGMYGEFYYDTIRVCKSCRV